jgi:UDP-N-acetylglucosamine--N-acetylmuramyl-(pentapeptide) pyrophosphoryl-undecaprenol N-acetylglucosamine transferase
MRCIFTGGGTLGHTNPAIAVAEKVREIDNNAEIIFLMRQNGNENSSVLNRGFKIVEIPAIGLERNGIITKNIQTAITAIHGIIKCLRTIKSFKPDFIFGTGGYVSFAPMIAGIFTGIPTYVHESNSVPGLVTRLVVKLGAIPMVNIPETKSFLISKKECTVVGMPILSDFTKTSKWRAREILGIPKEKILIVSFAGSGGAEIINEVIMSNMAKRSNNCKNIIHIHATGSKYFIDAKIKHPILVSGLNGKKIVPKIENMAIHMCAADIIICRCGAATLAEITSLEKAAILIPSPNVTDNHQYKNGKLLSDKGAAIMIEENDLTEDVLSKEISSLVKSKETRKNLSSNIAKLKKNNSADTIARILLNTK